jgi:hypothetical protein
MAMATSPQAAVITMNHLPAFLERERGMRVEVLLIEVREPVSGSPVQWIPTAPARCGPSVPHGEPGHEALRNVCRVADRHVRTSRRTSGPPAARPASRLTRMHRIERRVRRSSCTSVSSGMPSATYASAWPKSISRFRLPPPNGYAHMWIQSVSISCGTAVGR